MGLVAYGTHYVLIDRIGNSKATIIAILIGAIIYGVMLIATKTLSKEDMYMIPFGTKLYKILVKLKIYKDEKPI